MFSAIFYGWWIVLATSLIHFWGAGTFFYSFTAFFNPVVEEFGWSYAATSFAASLRSFEGGIASPLVGWAADRYGARRLLLAGSVFSGLGFILFSQIQSLLSFYLVFIFLSVCSSFLYPVPGWTAVTNWFIKKRGLTIGILSAAIGCSGAVVFLVNALIGQFGWRTVLIIIGLGTWAICIPCSLIVRHAPESYGLLPDGKHSTSASTDTHNGDPATTKPGFKEFGVRQALRNRAFWILSAVVTVSGGTVHAVTVHIMPDLINLSFSRASASLAASMLILVSVAGRFGFGWLGNRFDKRHLLVLGLLLQVIGLLCLASEHTSGGVVAFVATFGPGFGGVITLRLTIQADYFGRKAFGTIQGITMALVVLGTMSGPFAAGLVFDLTESYRIAWLSMAAALAVTIPFALCLRPPEGAPAEAE
jgi:sugar phosphate permease